MHGWAWAVRCVIMSVQRLAFPLPATPPRHRHASTAGAQARRCQRDGWGAGSVGKDKAPQCVRGQRRRGDGRGGGREGKETGGRCYSGASFCHKGRPKHTTDKVRHAEQCANPKSVPQQTRTGTWLSRGRGPNHNVSRTWVCGQVSKASPRRLGNVPLGCRRERCCCAGESWIRRQNGIHHTSKNANASPPVDPLTEQPQQAQVPRVQAKAKGREAQEPETAGREHALSREGERAQGTHAHTPRGHAALHVRRDWAPRSRGRRRGEVAGTE